VDDLFERGLLRCLVNGDLHRRATIPRLCISFQTSKRSLNEYS
jgi:hypothetical protein